MPPWVRALRSAGRAIGYEALLRISTGAESARRPILRVLKSSLGWPAGLSVAIKITARSDKRQEWGDFHFAESLQEAFERRGHRARIDFPEQWYDDPATRDDVVLVLRGLTAYRPAPGPLNVMWNISHPDQVPYEEYDSYDLVCVASLSYPAFLRTVVDTPVLPLLQATDRRRFHPWPALAKTKEILFVGNSRGEFRPIIRWALQAGLKPSIYGTRWQGLVPKGLVKGQNIANRSLSRSYARAAIVLNDHWESMRQFGLVSNRIFDVLASGGTLISDSMPTIDRLFGQVVQQVDDAGGLAGAVAAAGQRRPGRAALRTAAAIRREHSFDDRAGRIVRAVRQLWGGERAKAGLRQRRQPGFMSDSKPLRIGLLLGEGPGRITQSEYVRLVSPLTSEALSGRLEVTTFAAADWRAAMRSDAVILQPGRLRHVDRDFLAAVQRSRTRLVLDLDGLAPAAPPAAHVSGIGTSGTRLLETAHQVWCSTAALKDHIALAAEKSCVVASSLDPRIWRDFRAPPQPAGQELAMLLLAGAGEEPELEALVAALDALHGSHPGRLSLTIVGDDVGHFRRDWLTPVPVPDGNTPYPRFARWLRKLGPFQLGLAVSRDSSSGPTTADLCLTYWALGAAPLVVGEAMEQSMIGFALATDGGIDGWGRSLRPLVSDPATIDGMRLAGYDHLWNRRSTDQVARLQYDLLKRIV